MKEYKLDEDFLTRYKAFLASPEYLQSESHQKTDYWESQSTLLKVDIKGNKLAVDGSSGFYVPQKNLLEKIEVNYRRILKSPLLIFLKLKLSLVNLLNTTGYLSYLKAFNKLMAFNPKNLEAKVYADGFSARSKSRINFFNIASKEGSFKNIKEVVHAASNRYKLNSQIIYSYYIFNILNFYLKDKSNMNVLEIGGGNGNLMSVIHDNCPNVTIFDVDLPETLSSAILFIKDLYPDSKIILPNEIQDKDLIKYDFVFMTPSQLESIQDNTFDLAVNLSSFQEMTKKQVSEYFSLISRSLKNNACFLTVNRAEKLFDESEPSRFSEYPWRSENKILAYELDPFFHLVNPNAHFLKIDKINKDT